MIIILERIPEETSKHDIEDFLSAVLKGKIFQKAGHIDQIKMSVLKEPQTHLIAIYALVFIDSDEVATRIIKKLNRKVINGKHISIREYSHRSWQNDQRISTKKWDPKLVSKRKAERRQSSLKVRKSDSFSYSSRESFHRKF